MASSSRDVELVVRARDEATKAINAVSDALNVLAGVQNTVSESGAKADGVLGQLGQAFSGLQREVAGLQALGTVATQLDRMSSAIDRLEKTNRQAGETASQASTKYDELAQAGAHLAAQATRAKGALDEQRAATKRAETEQKALNDQVKQAESAYSKLYTSLSKAKAPTDEQASAYRTQISALNDLLARQQAGSEKLSQQREALASASKEYGLLDKQVQANASAQDKMWREVERANNVFVQSGASLAKARAEFSEIQVVGENAAHVLGDVALNQQAISEAADAAAKNLDRVKQALAQQQSAGVGAPASTIFGSGPAGAVTPTNAARSALVAGKDAVAQAAEAYKAAQKAVADLNREIKASDAPTQRQAADLLLAKQAAAQAKGELEAQRVALERLRAETRNYIGSQQGAVAVASALKSALSGLPPIAPQLERDTAQARSFRQVLASLIDAFKNKYAPAVKDTEKAQQAHNNSSRESLSLFQRLRGEVSSLVVSYIGLQAALHQLGEVVNTFRTLEQAQAQLMAAHDGDKTAVARDMGFITDTAEQLGVRLSVLAGEYAKLSIAANAAGYSSEGTRKIFVALAEGARVANLDTARYERVLYDFQKIIEFGKIDARDFNGVLRQIPGAAQAMADALGVSKDQIMALQKAAGGIPASEAVLSAFADNLSKRFAGQLPNALKTFNAELGRFQTAIEESQSIVARSGFVDALTASLHRMTEAMRSDAGQRFFANLGRALGNLASLIPFVVSHLGLLWTTFQLFVSLRVAEWFLGLVPAIMSFVEAVEAATTASLTLEAALGGIPLILGGLVFLLTSVFGSFVAGVSDLDKALDDHALTMEKFQRGFEEAGEKVDGLREKLKDLSLVQLQRDRDNLQAQLDHVRSQAQAPVDSSGADTRGTVAALKKATEAFKAGKMSAEDYKAAIDKIAQSDPKLNREVAAGMADLADHAANLEKALGENAAQQRVLSGTATAADQAVLGLGKSVDGLNKAFDPSAPQAYLQALEGIKRAIPELAKSAEAAQKVAKLDQDLEKAKLAAKGRPNEKQLVEQATTLHDRAVADIQGGAAVEQAQQGDFGRRFIDTARRYDGDTARRDRGALESLFGSAGVTLDPEKAAWCAAFLQAVLSKNGVKGPVDVNGNPSVTARSFANWGTQVKGAEAQPGDVVLIKGGGGNAINHVGLFDGFADGGNRVRVLGGNQADGKVNEETFPASWVAAIRRAPSADDQTKAVLQNESSQEKFNKSVIAAIAELEEKRKAGTGTKVEQAGERAAASFDRQVAESGPTPDNPNRARLTFDPALRQRLVDAAEDQARVQQAQEETAKVGELQKAYADIVAAGKQISVNEEAADALRQKGFELKQNELGVWEAVTAQGKQALAIETQIVEVQRQKQQIQAISGQGEQLKQLNKELKDAFKEGDIEKVKELRTEIAAIKAELEAAIPPALSFAKALGDQRAVANLQRIQSGLSNLKTGLTDADEINKMLGNGFTRAMDTSFNAIGRFAAGFGKLKDVIHSVRDAFLQFAGDFLKQIAEMILKFELMKLLKQSGLGDMISGAVNKVTQIADAVDTGSSEIQVNAAVAGSAAFASTAAIPVIGPGLAPAAGAAAETTVMTTFLPQVLAAVHHTGGIVGAIGSMMRPIDPSVFANAVRYHTGGLPGLAPNEVPTILENNEEVLTRADPRHILNGGKSNSASPPPQDIKIVNAFDHGEVLSQALNTTHGQKAIVNFVRNNKRAVNQALKG